MITLKLAGDALKRMERAAKVARTSVMRAVRKAATRVQRQAKINVRQTLNTTGQSKGVLSRSITTVDVPGEGMSDFAMAVGSGMIYARIHEYGGVIVPVHAQKLVFPHKDGGLAFVDSVTIPARPYLNPALDACRPWIENDLRDVADYVFNDRAAETGGDTA